MENDLSDQSDLTDLTDHERWTLYAPWLEHEDPAVRANALINQANYLLDQQIAALEEQFVGEGGLQRATRRPAYGRTGQKEGQKHSRLPEVRQANGVADGPKRKK